MDSITAYWWSEESVPHIYNALVQYLICCQKQDNDFLHQTVAGDESWCYKSEPESKWQSMQLKHPESLKAKHVKLQCSAGKVIVMYFFLPTNNALRL